jgi:hypothetical protein
MNAAQYIELLLKRQADWKAEHPDAKLPPLLEWFVRAGDLEDLDPGSFKV